MPELPEVETICAGLRQKVLNKTIKSVTLLRPQIVKYPSPELFCQQLAQQKITSIKRRAKYIKFTVGKQLLLCHLRMTGGFLCHESQENPGKYTRIIFSFTSGDTLHYEDLRALGSMKLYAQEKESKELAGLGVEPLTDKLSVAYLMPRLQRSGKPIRDWLLDQQHIGGIGNIYASEILFRCFINPLTPAHSLNRQQVKTLTTETKSVLKEAIMCCGTTFSDYTRIGGESGSFQDFLRVYQKASSPCPNCSTLLIREKIHGRSLFYCPSCQPLAPKAAQA